MKKITLALALTASIALMACGEEKTAEPAQAPAAPAAVKSDEAKAENNKVIKNAVRKRCQLKLKAKNQGTPEAQAEADAFVAKFAEKFAKTPQEKIKALKAEIGACKKLMGDTAQAAPAAEAKAAAPAAPAAPAAK